MHHVIYLNLLTNFAFQGINSILLQLADVCVLLLVFNAAKFCPQILSLFEEHIRRHYRYLRDTISTFVPPLQASSSHLSKNVIYNHLELIFFSLICQFS